MVYRAKDKSTGGVVALKKVRMDRERDGKGAGAATRSNIGLWIRAPPSPPPPPLATATNAHRLQQVDNPTPTSTLWAHSQGVTLGLTRPPVHHEQTVRG